jgi:hypothetical protein
MAFRQYLLAMASLHIEIVVYNTRKLAVERASQSKFVFAIQILWKA